MSTPLDQLVQATQARLAVLGQARADGMDTLAWRLAVQETLKHSHITAAALAQDGYENLTRSDLGVVGARLKFQYDRLAVLGLDTAPGSFDGAALARLAMYGSAPRGTFYDVSRRHAGDGAQARNVLGVADHCAECEGEAARGWVPADAMSLPGERQCLSRCACSLEFRAAVAAEAVA